MGTIKEGAISTAPETENIETIIQIKNGKLFVNGEETSHPEQIGYAVLDVVEQLSADIESNNVQLSFVIFS